MSSGHAARGVSEAWVAAEIVQDTTRRNWRDVILMQQTFELLVLLGKFILVLRHITIYLLQAQHLILESFDVQLLPLTMRPARGQKLSRNPRMGGP